ncbi:hypothetical protein PDE_06673 [Penicillium oxalicum 114-2]|uniref:Uncharacterized protein n=1 Tax=Penicillium oxalicum (strain 114-2 / CGMCC 5302) TaxID=933388 RepID=S7ZSM1_PENO1|nr:hypothetical protein PDE_06673 [Penicillium oxalicum 114-2]
MNNSTPDGPHRPLTLANSTENQPIVPQSSEVEQDDPASLRISIELNDCPCGYSEDESPFGDRLWMSCSDWEEDANNYQSENDDNSGDEHEKRIPPPAGEVDYVHFGKGLEYDGEGWIWEQPDGDFWSEV